MSSRAGDAGTEPAPEPGHRLRRSGRRWRMAAVAAGLALLLGGSLWGSDDSFPLGPMKMYAYANRPDGVVTTAHLRGVTEDGRQIPVRAFQVGLRRAELEGQRDRFSADPRYLRALARTYERREGVRLVELRLEQWVYRVVDRRVRPEATSEVLTRWSRP